MAAARAKTGSRKLRPEDPAYIEQLSEVFPFCGYIEGAEHRGITHFQLQRVITYAVENCGAWRDLSSLSDTAGQQLSSEIMNLHHLNDWLIRPATRDHDCSCVELLTGDVQTPDWFVSHWWGEKIVEFLDCLNAHINTRCLKAHAVLWVCAYANRQHSLDEDMNVSSDPRDSSFFKAMKLAQGLILILDSETTSGTGPATPFKRIWCAFEVSMAILHLKKPIDIVACQQNIFGYDEVEVGVLTEGLTAHEEEFDSKNRGWGYRGKVKRESGFPADIVNTGLDIAVESADASFEIDRVRILNCIAGCDSLEEKPLTYHENYRKVNSQLRSYFALAIWFQAIQSELIDVERLADAVLADEWRTSLVMNFGFCTKMDDAHLAVLSRSITRQLHFLELHLWMCQSISNLGLEVLSKALPDTLETLVLNFQMCVNVGSNGVASIGRALESLRDLKVLRLSFEWDKSILSVHGLTEGIANLPKLSVLDLDLGALHQLNNKEVVAIAKVLPKQLKNLNLSLQLCTRLDNTSVVAIADNLPSPLTILNLNFKGCELITNLAVETLAQHMPQGLLALHINFQDCARISEPSIVVLVRALPEALYGAKLNLQGTDLSADKQKICRRLDRMRKWISPVKPRSESIFMEPVCALTGTAEKPLLLRSINRIVTTGSSMPSPTSCASMAKGDALAVSAGSLQRPRSCSSLKRPTGTGHTLRRRPHSSQSVRRQKATENTPDVAEEKPLAGTLHHYFHHRTSALGWALNSDLKMDKALKPKICRPVQAPASVYWATSPDAMFIQPRSLFQGLSEPVWRPLARG